MWGGRFASTTDSLMQKINASIDCDKRLFAEDIAASVAHAEMLGKQNIISRQDAADIVRGLQQIHTEIANGEFAFTQELEDIHTHIEHRLKQLIGPAAARLHTGRSRNDQVVTDMRLWLRQATQDIKGTITALIIALLDQAERHAATLMPGYTHLQVAQPISFGHHLLAYVEMFERDLSRFNDSHKRLNLCPLGAAALGGTSFPIDRFQTAAALGFEAPMKNSMDAVSARDFILEFLAIAAIHATHLSRLAEEIVLWCSDGFGFIRLSDRFTTGSSIMPQKRNPDAAELVRAKAATILGHFMGFAAVIKALPLSYGKDMQEDKPAMFAVADNLSLSVQAMTAMISDLTANPDNMQKALQKGYPTATDLADKLVKDLHMPFRDAHHVSGEIVRLAESKNCTLEQLPLADMQAICGEIDHTIYSVLSSEAALQSRTSYGGSAPKNVIAAVVEKRTQLKLSKSHE